MEEAAGGSIGAEQRQFHTGFATFLVTPSQAVALLALQVLALPSACLVAGIVMWRHRRRL